MNVRKQPYHWYAMAGNSHPIHQVSDIVPTRGAAQSVLLVREKEVRKLEPDDGT
jgi:hypothetical protein